MKPRWRRSRNRSTPSGRPSRESPGRSTVSSSNRGDSGWTPASLTSARRWLDDLGRGDAYRAKVFETHWIVQKDISDPAVLGEIADRDRTRRRSLSSGLADEERQAEVLGEELGAQQVGIRGVPTLIIDNRYLISGARPPKPVDRALSGVQKTRRTRLIVTPIVSASSNDALVTTTGKLRGRPGIPPIGAISSQSSSGIG